MPFCRVYLEDGEMKVRGKRGGAFSIRPKDGKKDNESRKKLCN